MTRLVLPLPARDVGCVSGAWLIARRGGNLAEPIARPWFKSAAAGLLGGYPGAYLQQRLGPHL